MRLLKIELYKIFKKPRTYISFIAITAIILIIQGALYIDGETYTKFAMQGLESSFSIQGNILNGYLIAFIILQTLLIQVPLLVALVTGDLIAGEAGMGTLRWILTKPITRTQLILTKFAAGSIYTILLLLWMALIALGGSILLFGVGDMVILKSQEIIILPANDVLWRYLSAFSLASLALLSVASLSFYLSQFADNAIGPIVATMAIIIISTILSTMDIPLFSTIKPYLFTTHMVAWKKFFDNPIPTHKIIRSAIILSTYTLTFLALTLIQFRKKDILT
jgi:ABC-2 type transport system permease protein